MVSLIVEDVLMIQISATQGVGVDFHMVGEWYKVVEKTVTSFLIIQINFNHQSQ